MINFYKYIVSTGKIFRELGSKIPNSLYYI